MATICSAFKKCILVSGVGAGGSSVPKGFFSVCGAGVSRWRAAVRVDLGGSDGLSDPVNRAHAAQSWDPYCSTNFIACSAVIMSSRAPSFSTAVMRSPIAYSVIVFRATLLGDVALPVARMNSGRATKLYDRTSSCGESSIGTMARIVSSTYG
jgi:hypothetical protein